VPVQLRLLRRPQQQDAPVIRNCSLASILSEVEHLHSVYGYTGIMFYDDELNVSKTLVELMNGLISDLQARLGVDFRLRGVFKAELLTETQAAAMYRAGFR
jgi:anaerobic magnesium-protoporphyrin IX monomethyl ester cyclase